MQQAEACSEIFVNKRFLEDLLQNPIDHVAYPFGGKSAGGQREAILVQDEGYTTAVTTHHGCVFERHLHSPHLLPRIGITGSTSVLGSLTCKSMELSRRCGNFGHQPGRLPAAFSTPTSVETQQFELSPLR